MVESITNKRVNIPRWENWEKGSRKKYWIFYGEADYEGLKAISLDQKTPVFLHTPKKPRKADCKNPGIFWRLPYIFTGKKSCMLCSWMIDCESVSSCQPGTLWSPSTTTVRTSRRTWRWCWTPRISRLRDQLVFFAAPGWYHFSSGVWSRNCKLEVRVVWWWPRFQRENDTGNDEYNRFLKLMPKKRWQRWKCKRRQMM